MPTRHPEKLEPAIDGSADWTISPSHNQRHVFGPLDIRVRLYERTELIGDTVYLNLEAGCAEVKATLTPDEAEALGAALLRAAGQARDNGHSKAFMDEIHERMTDPDGGLRGAIYVHPHVHYCHPDNFVAQAKQLPEGHVLIADETCERATPAQQVAA